MKSILAIGSLFLSGIVMPAWAGPGQIDADDALGQTATAIGAPASSTGPTSASSTARPADGQPSGSGARSAAPRRWRTTVELGVQNVENLDNAVRLEIRGQSPRFGFGVDATRYFERAPGAVGAHDVFMDIWVASGRLRALEFRSGVGTTSFLLHGGIVGTNTSQSDSLGGFVVGADIEHAFNSRLVIRGMARQHFFDPGVRDQRAREMKVQLNWYYVNIGYRGFAFDGVGELLHGPEVGLNYTF